MSYKQNLHKKFKYPKNILTYLLETYPNKNWNWGQYGISYNPNLTLELIEKYINKINFNVLSRNTFKYHNKKIKRISEKIKLYYYLSFTRIIYDIKRHIVTTF